MADELGNNVVPLRQGGRPSERDKVRETLVQMRDEGYDLSLPHAKLAEEVARRNGRKLVFCH
jgi:hypothetical protein